MKYRIELTATAQSEADDAYHWLSQRTAHATAWFSGLEAAIEKLADFPKRWPLAREGTEFVEDVRQLLYGKSPHVYRVLFIVRPGTVHVLHIRHSARRTLRPIEMRFPE